MGTFPAHQLSAEGTLPKNKAPRHTESLFKNGNLKDHLERTRLERTDIKEDDSLTVFFVFKPDTTITSVSVRDSGSLYVFAGRAGSRPPVCHFMDTMKSVRFVLEPEITGESKPQTGMWAATKKGGEVQRYRSSISSTHPE
jgi:hypothetical protein